jgi:hypothetical protein
VEAVNVPDIPIDLAEDSMRQLLRLGCEYTAQDYSSEEWAAIKQSLQYLQPGQAPLTKACAQLRQARMSYRIDELNAPSRAMLMKQGKRRWARIAKICAELQRLLFLVEKHEVEKDHFHDEQVALMKLRMIAGQRLREHEGNGIPLEAKDIPKSLNASPRVLFIFCVLKVWTNLGGKLRISRHPKTNKIKGPLARYFAAATHPVIGGSLESLPDAIARQESMLADARQTLARLQAREMQTP